VIRPSLGAKIALASSGLIVALIGATLYYISYQADRFVDERLTADLRLGSELIAAAEQERFERLRLTALNLASFPELKALFGTDAATIRDFLVDYRQRARGTDLILALDPEGRTLARTDADRPLPIAEARRRWVEPGLSDGAATGVLDAEGRAYHAAAVPVEAGGTLFGFVLSAGRIDAVFAQTLRDASRDEVVILDDHRVLASTLGSAPLPWRSRRDGLQAGETLALRIGGEQYAALAAVHWPGSPVTFVSLQSRDRALAPYRRIQIGLIVLGVLSAFAGIAGSTLVARTVTAPVAKLTEGTRLVADGDFDVRIHVDSRDELGELAAAFNGMTQGLRERADMQHDLQIGRLIQSGFLPGAIPQPPGWEIAARFQPARQVAGDFYDAFPLADGCVGVVVADVCDKGVGAALFMALVRSLIRAYLQLHHSVSAGTTSLCEAIIRTNDYIGENHRDMNMFATTFAAVVDSGTGAVTYVNCGHNPPALVGSEGIRQRLAPTGPALGIVPGFAYQVGTVQLAPGDMLVAFTDGATDARNAGGEFFTERRLLSVVLGSRGTSAERVVARMLESVTQHIGTAAQYDDVTLLVVHRAGA
jgi:sigma-B regulation protein RsbU (phosphoserine phosphatase)